jgi:predicted dehydrogenase
MTVPINVALAGIGGYGKHYLDALLTDARSSAVRLVGVVEPSASPVEQLQRVRELRVPVFASLDSLFASARVDLMLLATPIHLHAEHTERSVSAGAHVLCEKPLGASLSDSIRMIRADRESGRLIGIGYQWSFSDAIQQLKADVRRGRFGRPLRLRSICNLPRPSDYFTRNSWAGRIRTNDGSYVLDSPVNNATSHSLHNMFYVLGGTWNTSVMPVSVQAELYRANDIENFDTAAVRCQTAEGVELLFYTTHATTIRVGPRFEFEFEQAVVRFDFETSTHIVAHTHGGHEIDYGDPNADRHGNIWQCVHAAVRGQSSVPCGVEASLPQTVTTVLMHESTPRIRSFPDGLIERIVSEEGAMISVSGLHETLMNCYQQGQLPSELSGNAWAVPARRISTAAMVAELQAAKTASAGRVSRPSVSTWVRPSEYESVPVLNRGGSA